MHANGTTTAHPLAQSFVAELRREAGATRRLIERVPEERLGWKPHPKSMSLGQLAMHIAGLQQGIARFIDPPSSDVPTVPVPEATSVQEVLDLFDQSVEFASGKLEHWGDDGLAQVFSMTAGEQTLMALPRAGWVRSLMMNHLYHHRGQLTVYLRLLDVPLPGTYGPTADEA